MAILLAVVGPLASSAADNAASVLARHAAYVGHPDGLVLTYRREDSASPKPTAAPARIEEADEPKFPAGTQTSYRRGPLYRQVDTYGGITAQEGFTGRAFWSSNENGYTVVDLEDEARHMVTSNLVDADMLAGDDLAPRLRPTQTIEGHVADVVRITPPTGVPADIAIDHASGAYLQVTYDPDNRYRHPVVLYDGYTEIAPGIRVPSGYHDAKGTWHVKLTEHAVRAVTNDDLRGPVPSAKWAFASTDITPIEVVHHTTPYPFLPEGQAVHIHATINGKAGTFLLDSGAAGIILNGGFAKDLKLPMLGRTGFRGVNGGGVAARYARVNTLQVGKNTLSNLVVAVAGKEGSIDNAGILGYDFLAGALVDVDIANQTIRILDPSAYEPTIAKGAYAFPINLASRTPEVRIQIGGAATRATFDTGDDFLAVLSDDLKRSGRLVALNDKLNGPGGVSMDYEISFYGIDGPANVPAQCSRLNEIVVGPYRYQNVETCFAPANVFGRDGGLIGIDILRHFNWTFDYAESKLVLTPNGK